MSPAAYLLPLLGVGLLIGLIALGSWLKRARANAVSAMRAKLQASGEVIKIDPEAGSFRGAERELGRTKCDGIIALTEARVLLRKLTGGEIEIPLKEIAGVSESPSFLGARRAGVKHLIIELKDGNRVGFYVRDIAAWIAALNA